MDDSELERQKAMKSAELIKESLQEGKMDDPDFQQKVDDHIKTIDIGNMLGSLSDMMSGLNTEETDRSFRSNIKLNRGSKFSAGYDICSTENVVIAPGRLMQVATGLIINIPQNFVFVLKTKSRHTVNMGMMNMPDGSMVPYSEIKKKYSAEEILEMMEKNKVFSDHSVTVEGGVIDADYDKPIFVSLMNHSKTENFVVRVGDQIAQGIIMKHYTFDEDQYTDEVRKGGFGSTN